MSRFLKWKENSDIKKPAISSISSLGFESKFLYVRWKLLTVRRCRDLPILVLSKPLSKKI